MAVRAILLICAQALLVKSVFSQCTSRAAVDATGLAGPFGYDGFAAPWAYDGLAYPGTGWAGRGLACDGLYGPAMEFTATSGGAMPVTSFSAIAPVGISIVSENIYEGALNVAGELPFVGTTAMEGILPTTGAGAINHACGNGLNAMAALSATSTPATVATMGSPAFTAPGLAYDGLIAPGFTTPTFGATGYGYNGLIAPGFAASSALAPGLAYDGLIAPALATQTFGTTAFGYDGLIAPGFAAPALAAPAVAYDGFAFGDAAWANRGLGYDSISYISPIEAIEMTPTSGGALPVSSASAIPPTGIAVTSENAYEGALSIGGELPFVGTVAMDGVVPTAGAGAINHACGNGRNAMVSETTGFAPAAGLAGAPGFGYRNEWAGRGCGCAF